MPQNSTPTPEEIAAIYTENESLKQQLANIANSRAYKFGNEIATPWKHLELKGAAKKFPIYDKESFYRVLDIYSEVEELLTSEHCEKIIEILLDMSMKYMSEQETNWFISGDTDEKGIVPFRLHDAGDRIYQIHCIINMLGKANRHIQHISEKTK